MRRFIGLMAVACGLLVAACGSERVDCEALCAHTLACEVSFAPPDDPEEALVRRGERTPHASCVLGCEQGGRVNIERASCVDAVPRSAPETCQPQVLACLEEGIE